MSNTNYRELKRWNNLPKYDLGSPIDKGYQASSNPALYGEGYTRNATPVTNAFVPGAISNAILNVTTPITNMASGWSKYISGYNSVAKLIGETYGKLAAHAGTDAAAQDVFESGLNAVKSEAAKESAKSAASKALGAAKIANIATNAYGSIHGIIDLANTLNNTKGLDSGELSLGGARYIDPLTGKELWGGLDYTGIDKYSNDLKKSAGISGASAGFESGAGIGGLIGSIFPGAGTLIGSGIGGVLGAIGGFFGGLGAGKKAKRRTKEAIEAYNNASNAHNAQEESEGISEQMRINADEGWNGGKANARVGALETKVHYSNGKPTKAHTYKRVPGKHEWRGDDYYDRLTNNDAIVGNLPDPLTGIPLSFEALPYSQMLLKGNKKQKEDASMALDKILKLQEVAQKIDNEDMKLRADKGINLNNYEGAWIPATNYLVNFADNYARKRAAEKDPIVANESFADNPYTQIVGQLMPRTVNVLPEYNALTDSFKHGIYNVNQSGYNPGAKMAMLSNLYANYMKNRTAIAASKTNRENEMSANYAQLLGNLGESYAQRKQLARQKYNDDLMRAYAQKRGLLDTIARDKRADWNSLAENLSNIIWGNKNIRLWYDNQKLERDKLNTPTTAKSTGAIRLPWTYAPIKQNIPYSTPSWDQVFRNRK